MQMAGKFHMSVAIAIVLFVVYVASSFFFLKDAGDDHAPSKSAHDARWTRTVSILVLVIVFARVLGTDRLTGASA